MLRRSFVLQKVSRSWTKASISAASAHFPESVTVDPAAFRTTSSHAAKDGRLFKFANPTHTTSTGSAAAAGTAAMASTGKAAPDVSAAQPTALPPGKTFSMELVRFKMGQYASLVRFNKPVGWLLLMIPCYWGSALAVTKALVWEGADPVALFAPFIPLHLAVLFAVGAYSMRSVGCVVNDMWDRRFDRMVERTSSRPLAAGTISMDEAAVVLSIHLAIAGAVAVQLSPYALLACLAITPIWIIYPFMKRITYAPQFFLGLCYNWGIFVGYAAVLGHVDLAICLPLYLGAVMWTIVYDTIYAYQDRSDDLKCGVKSTAIWIGERRYILDAMLLPIGVGLVVSGVAATQSLPFYVGAGLCLYNLHTIIDDVNIYDRWSCQRGFNRNVRWGFYVFLAMCAGNLLWAVASEHESEKDAAHNTTDERSALMKVLFFERNPAQRLYNTESFTWVDRMLHPAFVQAECAKAAGATEPPPIPSWMRREYFGENMGHLLRFFGVPEETVQHWQEVIYKASGQYTMFSKVQL